MQEKQFKTFAKEAKLRFKSGYWQNFCEVKQEKIETGLKLGKSEEEINKVLSREAKYEIKRTFNEQTDDDILYNEVCELLSSDEIVFNPIKRLINQTIYDELDEQEKKNYVICLSAKFEKMRDRFFKENAKIG